MDVELRHLRYAIAVADTLNFTRAAAQLHMAQPALSARIRDLERALGVPLFRRTTRRVELTDAGADFVAAARQTLAQYERTLAAARPARPQILTVGFFGAAALELTVPLTKEFTRHHPGTQLRLRQFTWADPTAGLADRLVDVALLRRPISTTGLTYQTLFTEPRVLCVHAGHPYALREQVSLAEVLDQPIVTRNSPDPVWNAFWSADNYRPRPPTIPTTADEQINPATANGTTLRSVKRVVVATLEEEFEAVASGRAVGIAAAAAPRFYPRPGIRYVPVTGLSGSELALAWHPDAVTDTITGLVTTAAALRTHHPDLFTLIETLVAPTSRALRT